MSHSGLTGWSILTPNGLQHLNEGKSEIRGPDSGAEILAGQKARVTRICPLQAQIPRPDQNHMSQTRKTMSIRSKNFRLSPVQNMSHSGLTGLTIPTPNGLQHLNEGKNEIRGPDSGAEILAGQKVRVARICPLQAQIPRPDQNHMSQTRKTMSITPKNFRLSPVQNMSHSGLTGLTIPTPNGLQHLNVGESEIRGPDSGAEILAGQKARVTRICPIRASIALPERNRMSQTRKTMSLTSKNFRLSPVQNMSHSGLTGLTIPTPGLQHLNVGESEIRGPDSGAEILAGQKARVTRICPIRASIALPERNRMSQTRKTMSLTSKNFRLSPVQNMSHSGLTGLTIPTPNGLQHLKLENAMWGIGWRLPQLSFRSKLCKRLWGLSII